MYEEETSLPLNVSGANEVKDWEWEKKKEEAAVITEGRNDHLGRPCMDLVQICMRIAMGPLRRAKVFMRPGEGHVDRW